MKTYYLIMAFSVAALTLASCGNEVDDVLDVQDEQIESKDSIFTYDMYFDSEITSYDVTTRATNANDWKDGDVVYIWFGGNNDAYGQAEYISSNKKWRVTCDKALIEAATADCSVWFYKGPEPKEVMSSGVQIYDYLSEAYRTHNGQYAYINNSIYVNATMKPFGLRLRFKGVSGTQIRIDEPAHYIGFHRLDNYCYDSADSISLKVGSNGYTDYFVVKTVPTTISISIANKTTNECFSRYFDSNTLKNGESGCYTIPTSTNLCGWTQTFGAAVDLGLPSGTKWASYNVGATKPEEYGNYYAWGETETKDIYSEDSYDYANISNDIAGSDYDVAHVKWGGSWRMPSEDQVNELIDNCTRKWIRSNGVLGTQVTGPNGNTIFLPHAGRYDKDGYLTDLQSSGAHFYWSSTLLSSNYKSARILRLESDRWYVGYWSRYVGFPVRPVCP